MPLSASTFKLVRQVHLYFGVFISPAILFFAITGALQTFSLHETTRGSSYKPPAWIAKLAQLHKKETLVLPVRRPQPDAPAKPTEASAPKSAVVAFSGPPLSTKKLLPLKIFFLIVSIGLVVSTFTGLVMSYRLGRSKLLINGLLLAGIAVPVLLIFLQ